MKSTDFIVESDDKTPEDVKQNHPEVYEFLKSLMGFMALDRTSVETYNTASSHMVVIKVKPSAGIGNTRAALQNQGIEYEEVNSPSVGEILKGSFNGIEWNVSDDGRSGNITEKWLFALPHKDDEVATPHDRTMEDGVANQNWFHTLAAALEAEGLSDTWDGITMGGIGYGETRRYTYDDGTRQGHFVSIYRDDSGRYERPVHYARGNAVRK